MMHVECNQNHPQKVSTDAVVGMDIVSILRVLCPSIGGSDKSVCKKVIVIGNTLLLTLAARRMA